MCVLEKNIPTSSRQAKAMEAKVTKNLRCQGVFKIIPDFLEGEQVDYVIARHEDDDIGQADSDRVLRLLVQDEGKPEVCEDVKGGGRSPKRKL